MVLSGEISGAASRGDTAVIQSWFSSGTRDPDEIGEDECTLLYSAAKFGHCDTMRFLLAHGASVDSTNYHGETPLICAAEYGKYNAAVLLLDRGAQVDSRDYCGWTPLINASFECNYVMIRLLLSRGANLDAHNGYGDTVEAVARYNGRDDSEAVALLADVRLAGGWDPYLRYPRKRLLALRVLCARGRAKTNDDLLQRLFPWYPPSKNDGPTTRAARRAPQVAPLPKEVFWLILKCWRSDRDD